MDSIYDPKTFRSSDNFPARSYFETYGELCTLQPGSSFETKGKVDRTKGTRYYRSIQTEMDVILGPGDLTKLIKECSISNLTLAEEPENMPMNVPQKLQTRSKFTNVYPTPDEARQLNVIKCKEIVDKRWNVASELRMCKKRFLKTNVIASNESSICDITPGSNFMYSIIIYKPHSINIDKRNSGENLRFAFEIDALGTNTLAEVADTIACVADIALFKEVENTRVDLKPFMNAKNHYPSRCFFIDGVFYNDRGPHCVDYSENIIKWAREKNIGKFTSDSISTLLNSLSPRLGYPYVYMHQGSCEHIMTFSDARLLQPGDCLQHSKYPRISTLNRPCNVLCFICGVANSQWIVLQCDKLPQEKVFLCTQCCNSYLYVDEKKITDFKLYPYYDEDMLTKNVQCTDAEAAL